MKYFFILAALVVWLLTGVTTISYAADIGKQHAANIAKSLHSGRIIDIQQVNNNGTSVYRVKILDDNGGIHIVIIDKSGRVISSY